jgi:DNA-directed RNA polymerase subunit RPC12/RpoP
MLSWFGEEESPMECPQCGSPNIERLPPSQISPHPGYRCSACGKLMRAPGMLFLYLAVLVIGVGLGGLFLLLVLGDAEERIPLRAIWLAGAGLLCAGYAVMQLARPVPRQKKHDREKG